MKPGPVESPFEIATEPAPRKKKKKKIRKSQWSRAKMRATFPGHDKYLFAVRKCHDASLRAGATEPPNFRMRVHSAPHGRVTKVELSKQGKQSRTGACVAKSAKRWRMKSGGRRVEFRIALLVETE